LIDIQGVGRNQFDGGFLQRPAQFGQEYGAVIGTAQPLAQRELSIDHLTFPRFSESGTIHAWQLVNNILFQSKK
jgi:hypothetical protein